MKIRKGPVPEGWYVSSSSGCGLDSAISLEYVQTPNDCACYSFSADKARELAKMLIKIANDFDEGIETGLFEK